MTTANPAVPERPGTVRMASLLLYLLALLQLTGAVISIITGQKMTKEAISDIYVDAGMARDVADTTAAIVPITMYAGVALAIVFGVLYLILGVFVGKGKQWARITAWVVGGIGLCCGVFALAGNALSGLGGGSGDFDQEQAQRAIEELIPAWANTATYVVGGISILALLVMVILLALPPSHPYFSKPAPEWTPPPATPNV